MLNVTRHDLSVDKKSDILEGKKIYICGGGGIAATEMPKIGRELRRYGASIAFFATENCLRFVGKESLEWASAHEVLVNPTGFAEHICTADLVLVFPATADLLGKMAHGVCDNGVTTLLQSALGVGAAVVICPTMHASLSASPIIKECKERLAKLHGVSFVSPRLEEGKEKAPNSEVLALEVCHALAKSQSLTRPISALVTLGGTSVAIDDVRSITNLSTGKLGWELVKSLYARGVNVTALMANITFEPPSLDHANLLRKPSYQDFCATLENLQATNLDGIFHVAAVSDYITTKQSGKISSKNDIMNIPLKLGPKLIDLPHLKSIPFRAGCKLTAGATSEDHSIALAMLEEKCLDLVLWNCAHNVSSSSHTGLLFRRLASGGIDSLAVEGKRAIAEAIADFFLIKLRCS